MLNVYRYSKTGATRRKVGTVEFGRETANATDLTADDYRHSLLSGWESPEELACMVGDFLAIDAFVLELEDAETGEIIYPEF